MEPRFIHEPTREAYARGETMAIREKPAGAYPPTRMASSNCMQFPCRINPFIRVKTAAHMQISALSELSAILTSCWIRGRHKAKRKRACARIPAWSSTKWIPRWPRSRMRKPPHESNPDPSQFCQFSGLGKCKQSETC